MISNLLRGTALSSASVSAGAGTSSVHAALLATIPYAVAVLSTLAVAAHADRRNEKTAHVGVPYVIGAAVLACFGPVARASTAGGFVMLTAAMGLLYGGQSTMCARVAGERGGLKPAWAPGAGVWRRLSHGPMKRGVSSMLLPPGALL